MLSSSAPTGDIENSSSEAALGIAALAPCPPPISPGTSLNSKSCSSGSGTMARGATSGIDGGESVLPSTTAPAWSFATLGERMAKLWAVCCLACARGAVTGVRQRFRSEASFGASDLGESFAGAEQSARDELLFGSGASFGEAAPTKTKDDFYRVPTDAHVHISRTGSVSINAN